MCKLIFHIASARQSYLTRKIVALKCRVTRHIDVMNTSSWINVFGCRVTRRIAHPLIRNMQNEGNLIELASDQESADEMLSIPQMGDRQSLFSRLHYFYV